MAGKRLSIRWSRRALDALHDGLAYIAQFNPEAARSLRVSIFEALEHARSFPEAARMVPEEWDPKVREVLRPPFRLIYEIRGQERQVLVVRGWSASRSRRTNLEAREGIAGRMAVVPMYGACIGGLPVPMMVRRSAVRGLSCDSRCRRSNPVRCSNTRQQTVNVPMGGFTPAAFPAPWEPAKGASLEAGRIFIF